MHEPKLTPILEQSFEKASGNAHSIRSFSPTPTLKIHDLSSLHSKFSRLRFESPIDRAASPSPGTLHGLKELVAQAHSTPTTPISPRKIRLPSATDGLLTAGSHKPLPKTPELAPAGFTKEQAQTIEQPVDTHQPQQMENMSRPILNRQNTMDNTSGNAEIYGRPRMESESPYIGTANGSQPESSDQNATNASLSGATPSPAPQSVPTTTTSTQAPTSSSTHLSGLMCNVHRTTGREPRALVGATTTILGDKLYVFGGKILSRTRAALTSDLYELDLIKRHWTKLAPGGDVPPPRYFHSVCALGDGKLVAYGGMSPQPTAQTPNGADGQQEQPEVVVMSDIHIYDVATNVWTYIPTSPTETPQGRYAHCATIMLSSSIFKISKDAPLAALKHNPSREKENEGQVGVEIDGSGGAEMIVVGGQDSANHYIEQISVFNLRSLKWTGTQALGKMCGAYRSVVAPVSGEVASVIGRGNTPLSEQEKKEAKEKVSSVLIYSNYNFLDVKLELQIRSSDGTLSEKPMSGSFTPPGLRFPNGGVIANNFVVSGTYLTSSKQEYALWALCLKTLTWSRIDAGGNIFGQGSWNRGVLWGRRNAFVVLGGRKRSLVEDYNHRRLNFSNLVVVELEAFGLYDNPRCDTPMSGFVSSSAPAPSIGLPPTPVSAAAKSPWNSGGRQLGGAAEELGALALASRELADMDILAVGGERIPVSSRIVARRWGPYFIQILREGAAAMEAGGRGGDGGGPPGRDSDAATLRNGSVSSEMSELSSGSTFLSANASRMSTLTITKSNSSFGATTIGSNESLSLSPTTTNTSTTPSNFRKLSSAEAFNPPDASTLLPTSRPRTLYLPHTALTIQALLHFLYTSSLPSSSSNLCTPQILCSLLQLARPYRIDGLVEAVVARLHGVLDSRNAAAIFNGAAMAAGSGRSLMASSENDLGGLNNGLAGMRVGGEGIQNGDRDRRGTDASIASNSTAEGLRINTSFGTFSSSNNRVDYQSDAEGGGGGHSAASEVSTSSFWESELDASEERVEMKKKRSEVVWKGEISAVIGLQKRGLRGLMEGRRLRERGQREGGNGRDQRERAPTATSQSGSVGLGVSGNAI